MSCHAIFVGLDLFFGIHNYGGPLKSGGLGKCPICPCLKPLLTITSVKSLWLYDDENETFSLKHFFLVLTKAIFICPKEIIFDIIIILVWTKVIYFCPEEIIFELIIIIFSIDCSLVSSVPILNYLETIFVTFLTKFAPMVQYVIIFEITT